MRELNIEKLKLAGLCLVLSLVWNCPGTGGDVAGGSTSDVDNPQMVVSLVKDGEAVPVSGSVSAFAPEQNTLIHPEPLFAVSLESQASFVLSDSTMELLKAASAALGKRTGLLEENLVRFNLVIETEGNYVALVRELVYDRERSEFSRAGSGLQSLEVPLETGIALTGAIDTAGFVGTPLFATVPGTNYQSLFRGNAFTFPSVPSGNFRVILLSDPGNDSLVISESSEPVGASTMVPVSFEQTGQVVPVDSIDISGLPHKVIPLSPSRGDILHAGDTVEMRWLADASAAFVMWAVSYDGGQNWDIIASDSAAPGRAGWLVPHTSGGGGSALSDEVYWRITAGFDTLNWSPAAGPFIIRDTASARPGCMDSSAFNFDSTANTDDGNCIPVVSGCTDSTAFNYDSLANTNDGSCIAIGPGCTDSTAFNYNPAANTDDGSCVAVVPGCTDSAAFNYDSTANTDDGSCVPVVLGCTDSTAFNYNPGANTDDGSCVPVVLGCTDSTAFNFNAEANTDDGSCIPVVLGCTDPTAVNYDSTANTNDGSCVPVVLGCTDSAAFNYNPAANTDDGSCVPVVLGCTDSTAFNYNPAANTDDGSCVPVMLGCTVDTALNYDSTANTDDGSCFYIELTNPAGGDSIALGSPVSVEWSSSLPAANTVNINFIHGVDTVNIVSGYQNISPYNWGGTVDTTWRGDVYFHIEDGLGNADASDSPVFFY